MIFCGRIDGNGNITAMVQASDGTAAAKYEYSPYGELLTATGSYAAANPFRFSTKYTDAETGLAYFGYRYYNPETGRWLTRDPIEEEGFKSLSEKYLRIPLERKTPKTYSNDLGLYAYVVNNPISNTDLFGLACSSIFIKSGSNVSEGLVALLHQKICVRINGVVEIGDTDEDNMVCFSYEQVGWRWFPSKNTWLGWRLPFIIGDGFPSYLMEGKIVPNNNFGTVISRKRLADWQAGRWLNYMITYRLGARDVYTPLGLDCRKYSSMEFASAPGR